MAADENKNKKRCETCENTDCKWRIAMNHLNKAVAIMREYGLYTKEAENSDCICDLAQLESYLIDVEMGCDE